MTVARPILMLAATFAAFGCTPPNAANIALRKELQSQRDEIGRLKRQLAATTLPTTAPADRPSLTPGQTETLVTVHGIKLGRLTRHEENMLTVYVVPTDVDEEPIKAAGAITVDAFDLTDHGRVVGHWAFDVTQTRPMWNGTALRYEYVVPCALNEKPPRELTVKVTFDDALTGRTFSTQTVVAARPE